MCIPFHCHEFSLWQCSQNGNGKNYSWNSVAFLLTYTIYIYILVNMYTPTEIVHPPQNTTVNLYKIATFTCETNGGDVTFWRVNGASNIPSEMLNDVVPDRERVGDNTLLTLEITTTTVEYNKTTIQCVTTDIGGRPVESEIVTLIIPGTYHTHTLFMTLIIHELLRKKSEAT